MKWLLVIWVGAWAAFSLPWTTLTSTPHWNRIRPPHVRSTSRVRLDHVLNVIFYLPAAPLTASVGWPLSAGVVTGSVMSIAAEGLQVFSEDRAPDGNDVVANIGGATAGAILLILHRRRRQGQT